MPEVPPTPKPVVSGDLCAGRASKLRVLVLDLKSGWFAGDGGAVFKEFTSAACGAKVEFTYAHVTKNIIEGNVFGFSDAAALLPCLADPAALAEAKAAGSFSRPDIHMLCGLGSLDAFAQVWVLSGSEVDSSDVPRDSKFFRGLKERLAAFAVGDPSRGVFLGAGLGNTQHANALAAEVLPESILPAGKTLFAPTEWGEIGALPDPENFRATKLAPLLPESLAAGLAAPSAGHFASSHPLMQGLGSLADYDRAERGNHCSGDGIALQDLHVAQGLIAVDACGQPIIAAFAPAAGPRVVLDGNMARFYVTKPSEWFNRIVNWLALGSK